MKNWEQIFHHLIIVDLETTGLSPTKDRIIEIAAVVVKGNKIVKKYEQFVNPGQQLDAEVTQITGINDEDLKDAPSFKQVAPEFLQLLNGGGVFVAHNAPFDYGFLESEFSRVDLPFAAPRLCTVQLSRSMYPGERSHGLDAISERFNVKIRNRHRALDDAMATWYFFQKVRDLFDSYALNLTYQQIFQPAPNKKVSTISTNQLGLLGI